jgi:DNA-binding CsgD family transcriptional regulator
MMRMTWSAATAGSCVVPDTDTAQTEKLRRAISEQKPTLAELVNYRKDGTKFRNAVMLAPLFDADGRIEFFIGSQVEIPRADDSIAAIRQQQAVDLVGTLSPRQREILQLMAQGYRTKQIAYMLTLSEKTVQMHRMLLFRKLSTSNAADVRLRIAHLTAVLPYGYKAVWLNSLR